jgi:hypothetical protein
MCLGGGGGGGSSVPQQDQRDAPENESPAVTANRDSLKADTSGLPPRPDKEYLGWQRDAKNDPNNKYHKGWINHDGTTYTPDWVKGSSQSSKRY